MRFEITVKKELPPPGLSGWAYAHEYAPENSELLAERGRVVALAVGETGVDQMAGALMQAQAGRSVLVSIGEHYFKSNGPIGDSLKASVSGALDKYSPNISKLSIGVLVVKGDTLYAALSKGMQATIARQGRTAVVAGQSEIAILSGPLEDGDTYALEHKDPDGLVSVDVRRELEIARAPVEAAPPELLPATPARRKALRPVVTFIDALLRKLPETPKKLDSDTEALDRARRRRVAPVVGGLLLLLLVVSVGFGLTAKRARDSRAQYEEVLARAVHDVSEAEALSGLNNARARQLVLGARDSATDLLERGVEDPELDALVARVQESLGRVAGVYESEPVLFRDLTLVKNDFQLSALSSSNGIIRILDNINQQLVSVDISSKETNVVAGRRDLFDAFSVASYADRHFVLSSDGVREVGDEVFLVIKPDEWSAREVLIAGFSGNIYVLDKEGNTILRHSGFTGGFSEGTRWFASGITVDVRSAVDWAIDGSIWVLSEGGGVVEYREGLPRSFAFSSSEATPTGAIALYTDELINNLYFLEPEKLRVLVTTKTGEYVAEYRANALSDALDIVVSEEDKRLVVATQNQLLEIGLEHL